MSICEVHALSIASQREGSEASSNLISITWARRHSWRSAWIWVMSSLQVSQLLRGDDYKMYRSLVSVSLYKMESAKNRISSHWPRILPESKLLLRVSPFKKYDAPSSVERSINVSLASNPDREEIPSRPWTKSKCPWADLSAYVRTRQKNELPSFSLDRNSGGLAPSQGFTT